MKTITEQKQIAVNEVLTQTTIQRVDSVRYIKKGNYFSIKGTQLKENDNYLSLPKSLTVAVRVDENGNANILAN